MPEPTKSRAAVPGFALVVGSMAVVAALVVLIARVGDSRPAAPAEPAMANIDVVSDPVGASVFRADDGGLIGIAPLVISLPRSEKDLVIITKHPGYQDRRSTVPLFSASGRIDIELIRIGAKERPIPPPPPDGWTP
jgi:hypothetical protein